MKKKLTILVVDNAVNNRRSLSRMLEFSGYRTVEAANGEDALEQLATGEIALTLMDVVLPGMGGLETACRIKAVYGNHPVVLMSAYARHFFEKHGLPEGVNIFLEKPMEPDDVLAAVEAELQAGS